MHILTPALKPHYTSFPRTFYSSNYWNIQCLSLYLKMLYLSLIRLHLLKVVYSGGRIWTPSFPFIFQEELYVMWYHPIIIFRWWYWCNSTLFLNNIFKVKKYHHLLYTNVVIILLKGNIKFTKIVKLEKENLRIF